MIWHGEIGKPTGYAEAARLHLRALATVGFKNVFLKQTVPIMWSLPPFSDPENASLGQFRGLDPNTVDMNVFLAHTDPVSAMRESKTGLWNICMTVWETDKLPGDARFALNGWYHETWVPSTFCRDVLVASGVTKPIHVVPHPIAVGASDIAGIRRPKDLEGKYVFYFIGSRNPRKNPQAALRAYLSEFRASDDVVFIYKTWSPAQADASGKAIRLLPAKDEVASLVAELKIDPKDAPRVVCIDRELTRQETFQIHAFGDCFVSSHRGEGFGLAIAEARALGRPCVATAWGGPNDFLDSVGMELTPGFGFDNGTDIGVPYALVPVAGMDTFRPGFNAGQRWADPIQGQLQAALRTMFNEKRRNVGPGRTTDFSLEKVGAQMADLLTKAQASAEAHPKLWKGGKAKAVPEVQWLSTFNERCGIAAYSENMTRLLRTTGTRLRPTLAPLLSTEPERDDPKLVGPYTRAWRKGAGPGDWLTAPGPGGGLLHIQHEFSFWLQEHALVEILRQARAQGWKTLVTLHTITPPGSSYADFFKAMCREADALSALGPSGVEALRGWAKFAEKPDLPIFLTPNVCAQPPPTERAAAREALNYPSDAFVLLTPGFASPLKRVGDILTAIEMGVRDGSIDRTKFRYVFGAGAQPNENNSKTAQALSEGAAAAGLSDVVSTFDGFVSASDFERLLTAADAIALFHRPDVISNSALAYDVLRFGKASLSAVGAPCEVLTEAESLKVESDTDILAAIVRLMTQAGLKEHLEACAIKRAEAFHPDRVAADLNGIYGEILRGAHS